VEGDEWQHGIVLGDSIDLRSKLLGVRLLDRYNNEIDMSENSAAVPTIRVTPVESSKHNQHLGIDDNDDNDEENENDDHNNIDDHPENQPASEEVFLELELSSTNSKLYILKEGESIRFQHPSLGAWLEVMTKSTPSPNPYSNLGRSQKSQLPGDHIGMDIVTEDDEMEERLVRLSQSVLSSSGSSSSNSQIISTKIENDKKHCLFLPGPPQSCQVSSDSFVLSRTSNNGFTFTVSKYQKGTLVINLVDANLLPAHMKGVTNIKAHLTKTDGSLFQKEAGSKKPKSSVVKIPLSFDFDLEDPIGRNVLDLVLSLSYDMNGEPVRLPDIPLICEVLPVNAVTSLQVQLVHPVNRYLLSRTGAEIDDHEDMEEVVDDTKWSFDCDIPFPIFRVTCITEDGRAFTPDPDNIRIKIVKRLLEENRAKSNKKPMTLNESDFFEEKKIVYIGAALGQTDDETSPLHNADTSFSSTSPYVNEHSEMPTAVDEATVSNRHASPGYIELIPNGEESNVAALYEFDITYIEKRELLVELSRKKVSDSYQVYM